MVCLCLSCKYIESKKSDDSSQDTIGKVSDSITNRPTINEVNIPIEEQVLPFVFKGYAVLKLSVGDVNLDEKEDCILVLKRIGEDKESTEIDSLRRRPLLILIRDKNNKLVLARRNDNTVLCYECGGVMGDPFVDVEIKDGYFQVFHYGGSAWRWTRDITFKYETKDQEWYLHQDESESFHAAEEQKVERTTSTVKDFGIIKFENFNIE